MNVSQLFDADMFSSVVRAVIPILLAAIGGLLCERAGVFNIALEGMMLVGSFGAVAGSYYTHNGYIGALTGVVAATATSLILAYGAVTRHGDPIVLGVAMNLFGLGITSFLLVALFHVRGVFQSAKIAALPNWHIPGLSALPWIGPVLFSLTVLGYAALLLVPVVHLVLTSTPMGLRLRGVGERPLAAASLGVSPARFQYGAVLVSGVLCGLAGAQLALGNVVQFSEGMSAGRGWIAVVAVMLARAHPVGVLGACLLFGYADALGFRLQGNGLPSQITEAAPYVVTLIALILARKRFRSSVGSMPS